MLQEKNCRSGGGVRQVTIASFTNTVLKVKFNYLIYVFRIAYLLRLTKVMIYCEPIFSSWYIEMTSMNLN